MGKESKFIELDGEVLNTADIVGIFSPQTVENMIRRKNGQWQGKDGKWYNRGDRVCGKCGNIIPFGKSCGYCQ